MPKEYVPINGDDVSGFRVKVGWNREAGYVQIATVDPELEESLDTSRDGGLYVMLDRVDINHLIRHLRRARDQAFGRDE